MYSACIFDLDGTLINSLEDLAGSVNYALRTLGYPLHQTDEYRYIVGNGAVKMIESALPPEEASSRETVEKALALFRQRYAKHFLDKTAPYEGISEALVRLQAGGIRLAVNSNKPDDFVKGIVSQTFGKGVFSAVIGQCDGIPRKPDPAGALEACRLMRQAPENCVFLGDSDVDIKTGAAAGMIPMGALWGFRTARELQEAGAKKLIARPEDIPGIFGMI